MDTLIAREYGRNAFPSESRQLQLFAELCYRIGAPQAQILPAGIALILRQIGPAGMSYPNPASDLLSWGGHSIRVWDGSCELYAELVTALWRTGLKQEVNPQINPTIIQFDPEVTAQVSTNGFTHDIGKGSDHDILGKSVERILDQEQREREREVHVNKAPRIIQILRQAIADSPNTHKHSLELALTSSKFQRNRYVHLSPLIHHYMIEGYPELNTLLEQNLITQQTADLIVEIHNFILTNDIPTVISYLHKTTNFEERAIIIALTITTAADIADAILLNRPYHNFPSVEARLAVFHDSLLKGFVNQENTRYYYDFFTKLYLGEVMNDLQIKMLSNADLMASATNFHINAMRDFTGYFKSFRNVNLPQELLDQIDELEIWLKNRSGPVHRFSAPVERLIEMERGA